MRTVMPLTEGKIARETGYIARKPSLVHCEEDGTIDIQYATGTPVVTVTLIIGEDRMFDHPLPTTVTITAGIFSFS